MRVGFHGSGIAMGTQRLGGRNARVRESIFAAATQLIAEKGISGVSIPDVAERAGVAMTSIYRRWRSIGGLLADLAASELSQQYPFADTGTLRGDLTAWAINAAKVIGSEEGSLLYKVYLATKTSDQKSISPIDLSDNPRSAEIEKVLTRATARGEQTPTVEEISDFILGPIYFRALFGTNLDEKYATYLVDRLLG